jgi:hypothetical protein
VLNWIDNREKVFDLEYEFNPSVSAAVSAIVPEGEQRTRILKVFESLSLNNLRIVSKVRTAVQEFERLLTRAHVTASERILENVVKIFAPPSECSFSFVSDPSCRLDFKWDGFDTPHPLWDLTMTPREQRSFPQAVAS